MSDLAYNATQCWWRSLLVHVRAPGIGVKFPLHIREVAEAEGASVNDAMLRVYWYAVAGLPSGATHWSRSTMAREIGISESSVGRIWRAHGLKPHRIESFKVSNDPHFAEKLEAIVGLYLNPPEHARDPYEIMGKLFGGIPARSISLAPDKLHFLSSQA